MASGSKTSAGKRQASAKAGKGVVVGSGRSGQNVFTPEHDAYVVLLRARGESWDNVARHMNAKFPPQGGNVPRTSGGLQVRYSRNIRPKLSDDSYRGSLNEAMGSLDPSFGDIPADFDNAPQKSGAQTSAGAKASTPKASSSSSKVPATRTSSTKASSAKASSGKAPSNPGVATRASKRKAAELEADVESDAADTADGQPGAARKAIKLILGPKVRKNTASSASQQEQEPQPAKKVVIFKLKPSSLATLGATNDDKAMPAPVTRRASKNASANLGETAKAQTGRLTRAGSKKRPAETDIDTTVRKVGRRVARKVTFAGHPASPEPPATTEPPAPAYRYAASQLGGPLPDWLPATKEQKEWIISSPEDPNIGPVFVHFAQKPHYLIEHNRFNRSYRLRIREADQEGILYLHLADCSYPDPVKKQIEDASIVQNVYSDCRPAEGGPGNITTTNDEDEL